jgi:hypothetical protein
MTAALVSRMNILYYFIPDVSISKDISVLSPMKKQNEPDFCEEALFCCESGCILVSSTSAVRF